MPARLPRFPVAACLLSLVALGAALPVEAAGGRPSGASAGAVRHGAHSGGNFRHGGHGHHGSRWGHGAYWGWGWGIGLGVPLALGLYDPYGWGPRYVPSYAYVPAYRERAPDCYEGDDCARARMSPADPAPATTEVPPAALSQEGAPTQRPLHLNYCDAAKAWFPQVRTCESGWRHVRPEYR